MSKEAISQIEDMFEDLNRRSARSFPVPGTLSSILEKSIDPKQQVQNIRASSEILTTFATAAVEMWFRSLHSFLISASLTEASPIWASVAGYYSSHYSIRGFAHLFGIFQLYKIKRIVFLEKQNNRYVCRVEQKGDLREHRFYWKSVSEHPMIAGDPFFYPNLDSIPKSDVSHRNKTNYWDHLNCFPNFRPLEQEVLSQRVERIANIQFSDVPVPDADQFPDIENVQTIAYHRIVKFRRCLDEVLKSKNRFWSVNRQPSWCPSKMKFNVADPVYLALYKKN